MPIITNLLLISYILSSQMKKEVKYYLEDISRLDKISRSELDAWVAEMPFHQPLQMLASIKSEMDGHQTDENRKVHAAYFAEDYEIAKKSKAKKSKSKHEKIIPIEALSTLAETKSKNKQTTDEEISPLSAEHTIDSQIENEATVIDGEVLEANKRIVSSDFADEVLEEEVIHEILEENIDLNIQTGTFPKDDVVEIEEGDLEIDEVKEENDIQNDDKVDSVDEDQIEERNNKTSEVDYSNFKYINSKVDTLNDEDEKVDLEDKSIKLDPAIADDISEKDKKDKKVKSKKAKSSKKKEKVKKKKKDKKESKKGKKESKKGKKDKKVKSKKAKSSKKKEKNKNISSATKKKKDKRDKKVEYIIVDSSKDKNFVLKDYDGVSSYASWLLEQESINDIDGSKHKALNTVKKSKKKKKKKKSKKLKIAADSIKKQDSIISETLARILALQGHEKKARKMYSKLAKVFPEKKAYFEEQINSLGKNAN
jgi:hypothetical protein